MSDNRKKPGWAFWATVMVVVVLAGYPLSFGPVCWLAVHQVIPRGMAFCAYRPILHIATSNRLMRWYCERWGASRQYLSIQEIALDYL